MIVAPVPDPPTGAPAAIAPTWADETFGTRRRALPSDHFAQIPDILRVRYGLPGGGEQVLLIPVSGGMGLARLPGYAAGRSWTADLPVAPGEMTGWDRADLITSIRAAEGGRTRGAWQLLGSLLPTVHEALGADEQSSG
jgi:hypothetical protein